MTDPSGHKERLRREYLAWREGIPPRRHRRWSRAVCGRLQTCPPLRSARDLLVYYPVRGEVDLRELVEGFPREGTLYLPRTDRERHRLVIHELVEPADLLRSLREDRAEGSLRRGAFGVVEPDPACCPEAAPSDPDAALVPGVVFDRRGARIGYGGGYYDRLLERMPRATPTVGVCFSGQLHGEALPTEPHDRPVGWLVWETEDRKTGRGGDGSAGVN